MTSQPLLGTPLSPREVEVLRLVAGGLTDAEVGRHLLIAENTVGSHMYRIRTRLGAPTRAAAVRAGFELGLLRLPDAVVMAQAREIWMRLREQRLERMRADLVRQAARRGAA